MTANLRQQPSGSALPETQIGKLVQQVLQRAAGAGQRSQALDGELRKDVNLQDVGQGSVQHRVPVLPFRSAAAPHLHSALQEANNDSSASDGDARIQVLALISAHEGSEAGLLTQTYRAIF